LALTFPTSGGGRRLVGIGLRVCLFVCLFLSLLVLWYKYTATSVSTMIASTLSLQHIHTFLNIITVTTGLAENT
jgi:hypothetical protein